VNRLAKEHKPENQGLCFFLRKIFWFPMLLKKIFWC